MIIKASDAKKMRLQKSESLKKLCEDFNKEIESGKINFHFRIPTELKDAKNDFITTLLDSGYTYYIVNENTLKIAYSMWG